jgi:hypothetical protein
VILEKLKRPDIEVFCIARPNKLCILSIESLVPTLRALSGCKESSIAPPTKAVAIKLAFPSAAAKLLGNIIAAFDPVRKTLPSALLAMTPLTDCPSLNPSDLASGGSSLKV